MRKRLSAPMLWLCAVLALLAPTPGARADELEPAGYRAAVEQALSEYGAKNYEEASALFARAHELSPNARTLRGLGMATFELRRYAESIGYLEAALASRLKPLEGDLRDETSALLTRARGFVATVTVDLRPPTAELLLDGGPADAKGPLLLGLGEHVLEVRADGQPAQHRSLRVRGGEVLRVQFALDKAPEPSPPVAHARPLHKSAWLWSGVGALVVGAAVTGVVLATRNDPESRTVPVLSATGRQGATLTTNPAQ